MSDTDTQIATAVTNSLLCTVEGCEKPGPYKNKAGLGRHKAAVHGIAGVTRKNKAKAKAKKDGNLPAIVEPVRVLRERRLIVEDGDLGMDTLLEIMFPKGIPPHKITATVNWVVASSELVR